MAALAGKDGKVALGVNTVLEISDWSLDVSVGNAEATDFGDSWQEFLYTIRGATGRFTGRFDPTDTNGHVALQTEFLSGTTGVSLRLYVNATNYYSLTALLSGVSKRASFGGLVEAEYSFVANGAVTYV